MAVQAPPQTPHATTVDRCEGPYGEVVLRERGGHFEIIANGCFLMDTSDGRSERLLVDAALAALPGAAGLPSPALLIGGLGVGFSPARAAAPPRWGGSRSSSASRPSSTGTARDRWPGSRATRSPIRDARSFTPTWWITFGKTGSGTLVRTRTPTTRSASTSTTAPTGP